MYYKTTLLTVKSHTIGCMLPTSHSIEIKTISIILFANLLDWQIPHHLRISSNILLSRKNKALTKDIRLFPWIYYYDGVRLFEECE